MKAQLLRTALCAGTMCLLAPLVGWSAADELVVYPSVPGLTASEHYKVRVRPAGAGSEWHGAFAWETSCKTIEKKTDGYFDTLAGWTHTYVNFETVGAVEIEIARIGGQPIHSAAVHPQRQASACSIKDGKAFVRLDKPCLVAVDIDGQMDAQDTGKGYKGPPLHTISIFANPPLAGKPTPHDPGVRTVFCIPAERVLQRNLTLPVAAEDNLRQVLAFEMDRQTPFKADQIYLKVNCSRFCGLLFGWHYQ